MVVVWVEALQVLTSLLRDPATAINLYAVRCVQELFSDRAGAVPRVGLGTVLIPRARHRKEFVYDSQSSDKYTSSTLRTI